MKNVSVSKKIVTCLLTSVVVSLCFLRIGKRFLTDWLSFHVIVFIAAILLLSGLISGVAWVFRNNQSHERSLYVLALWQSLLRYGIAMDLSMIGFQKFFGLQFSTPLGALDLPFSSFSLEDLTWAYFGQSRILICVIGGLQILGSLLLLFNRTKLVGVFILLPVMTNIVLLNYCYHMEWGESIQASELLLGIVYLLFSEYKRLRDFFFKDLSNLPSFRLGIPTMKNILRVSVILIPLLLIFHYGRPDKYPWLTGKYRVTSLSVNNRNTVATSCADSVLTVVYFDKGNDCVFEFNNQQRRLFGIYQFEKGKRFDIVWHYPQQVRDTFIGKLSSISKNELAVLGNMGKDSLQMRLVRIENKR